MENRDHCPTATRTACDDATNARGVYRAKKQDLEPWKPPKDQTPWPPNDVICHLSHPAPVVNFSHRNFHHLHSSLHALYTNIPHHTTSSISHPYSRPTEAIAAKMAEQPKEELQVRSDSESGEQASTEAPKEEQKGTKLGIALHYPVTSHCCCPQAVHSLKMCGEYTGSILSAPGAYGNAAGDKIQGTLGKVGNPVVRDPTTLHLHQPLPPTSSPASSLYLSPVPPPTPPTPSSPITPADTPVSHRAKAFPPSPPP